MYRVLSFDVGVKNLAYCITEVTPEDNRRICFLEKCCLLDNESMVICNRCGVKASVITGTQFFCKRHIPPDFPMLRDSSGNVFKKIPTLKILSQILKTSTFPAGIINSKPTNRTRQEYIDLIVSKFSLPYKQKMVQVDKQSIDTLHDGIRTFIQDRWELFKTCSYVLIENQPAFKNPKMKTVQILLYSSLREQYLRCSNNPIQFHLVHAKKKVQNAQSGDVGYTERKRGSEYRVQTMMTDNGKVQFADNVTTVWKNGKKKDDMADAICMCIDFSP